MHAQRPTNEFERNALHVLSGLELAFEYNAKMLLEISKHMQRKMLLKYKRFCLAL